MRARLRETVEVDGRAFSVACERVEALVPNEEAFARVVAALPGWRREACDALRFEKDRKRSVAAWLLLERLLAERGVEAVALEVARGPWGKPFFPARPDLHFSLSHAAERVMAVVGEREVGCDVERIAPVADEVWRSAFAPEERAEVESVPEGPARERTFAALWVRKEAYAKGLGRGLALPFPSFSVAGGRCPPGWRFCDCPLPDAYAACWCCRADTGRLTRPSCSRRVDDLD